MARHRRMKSLHTFDYHVRVQYLRLYGTQVSHDILQRGKAGRLMHTFWKQGLSVTDAARAIGAEVGKEEAHTGG